MTPKDAVISTLKPGSLPQNGEGFSPITQRPDSSTCSFDMDQGPWALLLGAVCCCDNLSPGPRKGPVFIYLCDLKWPYTVWGGKWHHLYCCTRSVDPRLGMGYCHPWCQGRILKRESWVPARTESSPPTEAWFEASAPAASTEAGKAGAQSEGLESGIHLPAVGSSNLE